MILTRTINDKYAILEHTLNPFYNQNSKILILGSFPSPKSRESGFYYGHPQNRFWKILSIIFKEETPLTNSQKMDFLSKHCIALWDVVASCKIIGADDNTIRDVKPNDLDVIINNSNVKTIFTTGKKADKLFKKFYGYKNVCLPSSSPANCAISLESLVEQYKIILDYLK